MIRKQRVIKGRSQPERSNDILTLSFLHCRLCWRGSCNLPRYSILGLLLLNFLLVHSPLDRNHRRVEFRHGQPEPRKHAGFPVLGKAFVDEHWSEVLDGAAEEGEHC